LLFGSAANRIYLFIAHTSQMPIIAACFYLNKYICVHPRLSAVNCFYLFIAHTSQIPIIARPIIKRTIKAAPQPMAMAFNELNALL
jgi:hypothetical protein